MEEFLICPKDFKQHKVRVFDDSKIIVQDSLSVKWWLKQLLTSPFMLIYLSILVITCFMIESLEEAIFPFLYYSSLFMGISIIALIVDKNLHYEVIIFNGKIKKTKTFISYKYANEYMPIKYIVVEEYGRGQGIIRICGMYGYSYMDFIKIASYSNNKVNRESAKLLIEKLEKLFEVEINMKSIK